MRRLKISAFLLGVVLLFALLVPFLIPLDRYLPQIQKIASGKLGEPVVIAELKFALLPLPSVTLAGITLGKSHETKIGAVTVRPDPWSLLSEVKVLRAVEIDGVTLDHALIGKLTALAKRPADGPQTIKVKRIQLSALQLDLDALKWGPLCADIALDDSGLAAIDAGSEDKRFKLKLSPGEAGQQLNIQAKNWNLPLNPALKIDTLTAKGLLKEHELNLPEINAGLYGGTLKAKLNASWKQGWKVKGEAQTAQVELKEIVALLTTATSLSGKLNANGAYTMNAKEAGQLGDNLRGNFKFNVQHGVLYGLDLERAVKSLATQGTRGGQTRFDELSGTLVIAGKHYQLNRMKAASGILSAQGNVDIAANKKLAGRVNVAMKGAASLIEVPLDVSGTVNDPVLFPNRAALAGAAAGTAIMGPGLGTSAGSKAGQALEKLFK
ncbi:MAG: AsmA family protein [Hydrogenophilales bacterium]|nr:AsmA family protein [Hydrogenophilales bacterium]